MSLFDSQPFPSVAIPQRPDSYEPTLLKRELLLKALRPKIVKPQLNNHRHVDRGRGRRIAVRTAQEAVSDVPKCFIAKDLRVENGIR
jgi:hypothetical protein